MSLVPLPKVVCGPLKPRKYPVDVPGTPNISYGHKLRERENCRIVKHRDIRGSTFEGLYKEKPEDKRRYEHLLKTWEFEKETNRKIAKKKVRQQVEQGMAAYEDSVKTRREKLRDLILNEETDLTREIVDQAQRGDENRLEEMRAETEELRKRQEEQRLAVVAAKRMQQYLARCPDIREQLSKRSVVDAKRCNVVQMAENEAKRQAERELDALWHELLLKEIEAKKRREVEEVKKKTMIKQETLTTLAKQVAGKLALEEERKQVEKDEREHLERLWENVRQEELKKLEREKQKRKAFRKDLEEQILVAKRFLVERAREETAVDQALKVLAEEELAKEKSTIRESTAALRGELLAYLKYLEELREEEARRNLEVDGIIEQSMKDVQARRDLAVRKFKEARERVLREVLRGREEQLRIKRNEEERERQLRQEEKELLEREMELETKLCTEEQRCNRERAIRYGRDLKEQQKYVETMRRRDAEEEERIYRAGLEQEEEYQRLTEELLKASENVTPHPFKILLRECAARQAAEKEGSCYCPPPLSE